MKSISEKIKESSINEMWASGGVRNIKGLKLGNNEVKAFLYAPNSDTIAWELVYVRNHDRQRESDTYFEYCVQDKGPIFWRQIDDWGTKDLLVAFEDFDPDVNALKKNQSKSYKLEGI